MDQVRIANGIALVAGAWLAISPFVLGYTSVPGALAVSLGGGALYMIMALGRLLRPHTEGPSWAMIGIAFIMMLAPMTFGFYHVKGAIPSQLGVAMLEMTLAVWSLVAANKTWRRDVTFAASEPTERKRPPR